MLSIHKILAVSTTSLLLSGMAIAANAQVISLTPQSITSPTDFSGSFLFPQFNPALGTLNQVDIVLGNSFTTQITVTNSSGSASSGHTATDLQAVLYDSSTSIDTSGGVITPTGGIFNLTDSEVSANQTYSLAAGGNTTLPSKSKSGTADSSPGFTDSGTLSYFTGLGNSAVNYLTLTSTTGSNTGGNTTTSQSTTDTLTATITYHYTPSIAGTPEPGTWAMLAAGASTGLVALRRRRNKK